MEELIHTYQYQRMSRDGFQTRKINNEIEAKVGWFLYQDRRYEGICHTQVDYDRQLGTGGTPIFQILSIYVKYPEEIPSRLYEQAIQALRTIETYSSEKYPESEKARNFDLLLDLMKNCLQL